MSKLKALLKAVTCALLLAACGQAPADPGGNDQELPPPAGAPAVTQTLPVNGTQDAALNSVIRLVFDRKMDTASTEAALSIEPAVSCAYSWNLTQTQLTCTPGEQLNSDTEYRVTLATTAASADGMSLPQPYQFSFRTGSSVMTACRFADGVLGACVFGP